MFWPFSRNCRPESGVRPPVMHLLKLMAAPQGWEMREKRGHVEFRHGHVTVWSKRRFGGNVPTVRVWLRDEDEFAYLDLNKAEVRLLRASARVLGKRLTDKDVLEWRKHQELAADLLEEMVRGKQDRA